MQINLDSRRLDAVFIICLLLMVSVPAIMPQLRLSFCAPFLIITLYQKTLPTCLLLAFLCGFLLDLLSSNSRLGLYAFNFCVTLMILYPQRRNFFADSISTLPIMTFLFGIVSTMIMALLLYSIESRNVFSWPWVITDLICMPFLDGLYAFILFILPPLLIGKPRRQAKDYFFN